MSTYFMTKIKSVWLKSKLNENKFIHKKKESPIQGDSLKTKKMKEKKLYYELIIIICIF